jgi:hypothetical protein
VNPAPGWYRDPNGENRWWDGARWTEHLHNPNAFEHERAAPQGPVSPEDDLMSGYRVLYESGRIRREGHEIAIMLWVVAVTAIFFAGVAWTSEGQGQFEALLPWAPLVTVVSVLAVLFALGYSVRTYRAFKRKYPSRTKAPRS